MNLYLTDRLFEVFHCYFSVLIIAINIRNDSSVWGGHIVPAHNHCCGFFSFLLFIIYLFFYGNVFLTVHKANILLEWLKNYMLSARYDGLPRQRKISVVMNKNMIMLNNTFLEIKYMYLVFSQIQMCVSQITKGTYGRNGLIVELELSGLFQP